LLLHLHLLLFFAAALADPKQLPMSVVTGMQNFFKFSASGATLLQRWQRSIPPT